MERGNNNKKLIRQIIIVALFPFLGSLLYCLIRGTNFFELYLPNSYNNDVLFYYKLVEGLTDGGIRGFFGFNESRALYGGFAAWNPLIVFPWVLWGKIFGWNYLSPILCNIFLLSVSLAIFVCLARPDRKSIVCTLIILALFPSLWIHLMNGLPEIIVASHLLVMLALVMYGEKSGKETSIHMALVIGIFLTIIRPYFIIFLLFSIILLVSHKKPLHIIEAVAALLISVIGNVLINHFFAAAYFESLFNLEFIKALITFRFRSAYYICGAALKNMIPGIAQFVKEAFLYGSTAGTQYFVSLVSAIFITVLFCTDRIKNKKHKKWTNTWLYLIYSISVVALFVSIILLLGKANEGGRHCFAFAIAGIVLLANNIPNKLGLSLNVILGAFLVAFIVRGAVVPTDYDIPMQNDALKQNVEYWNSVVIDADGAGYDNTIIWPIFDVSNDALIITDYNELYGMPTGMGISCCEFSYLINNIDRLNCKYIAVSPEGSLEEVIKSRYAIEIGRTENLVLYCIR